MSIRIACNTISSLATKNSGKFLSSTHYLSKFPTTAAEGIKVVQKGRQFYFGTKKKRDEI